MVNLGNSDAKRAVDYINLPSVFNEAGHPCPKGRNPSAKTCPEFCFRESFSGSEISIL